VEIDITFLFVEDPIIYVCGKNANAETPSVEKLSALPSRVLFHNSCTAPVLENISSITVAKFR
jgi:hypothetical protein